MFKDYSQTYASQILVLAGLIAMLSKGRVTESDAVFLLGGILNVAGIVWAIVARYKKGDVSVFGARK